MAKLQLLFVLLIGLVLMDGCTASKEAARSESEASAEASDDKEDKKKDGNGIKPYSEVITDEAVSDSGLFVVHRIDEKVYFEIPDSLLEVEMLLVSRIAATANNIGYGGMKVNC